MGTRLNQIRTGLLGTAFALVSACSFPLPVEAQQPPDNYRNYYLDDGGQAECVAIDGRGAQTKRGADAAQATRSTLMRFPLGLAAVTYLDTSGTSLCFTNGGFSSAQTGNVHEAEYKHRQNLILYSGNDAGHLMHEWKHKYDGVDFDSFEMTPYSAVMTLRFAEAGAYAFEAMARSEARENGVTLPRPARGSMMERLVNIYDSTLSGGGGKEQAWRNAFDATFDYTLKDVQAGTVISAYEQALDFPEIRARQGFARRTVTQDYLKGVALPPGWDTGVFDRTGGGQVFGDARYITYREDHRAQMENLQGRLEAEVHPPAAPY